MWSFLKRLPQSSKISIKINKFGKSWLAEKWHLKIECDEDQNFYSLFVPWWRCMIAVLPSRFILSRPPSSYTLRCLALIVIIVDECFRPVPSWISLVWTPIFSATTVTASRSPPSLNINILNRAELKNDYMDKGKRKSTLLKHWTNMYENHLVIVPFL